MNLAPALHVLLHAIVAGLIALHGTSAAAAADRCLMNVRQLSAASVRVDVARNSFVESTGKVRLLDAAVVRLTGVRVGNETMHAEAGFAVTRQVDTGQAWVSFAPSWDSSLAGVAGFTGDVNIWLSGADGRFADDSRLSNATGAAYEYVAAVLAHAPELLRTATFTIQAPAAFDQASVIQVLETVRTRLNIGMGAPGGQLPRLAMTPAGRLRGAQLGEWQKWEDPLFSGWSHICEFPASGGNVFRVNVQPYYEGQPVLPGRPLAQRLAKNLERLGRVIEWSLQHNVHVILAVNNSGFWPAMSASWPDDGRPLWTSASAQDELVDAWRSIALAYKGRPGLLFQLLNEPHNLSGEDYATMVAAWNSLYPRLVDAIRGVDPERWIIVTPRWSATNELAGFAVPRFDKVIIDIHAYAPQYFTSQGVAGVGPPAGTVTYPSVTRDSDYTPAKLWNKAALAEFLQPAIDFGNRHGLRMMCGELGANASADDDSRRRWVADMLDLCESNGMDYSYWAYGAGADFGWGFEQTPFRSTVTDKLALNLFSIRGAPSGPLVRRLLAVTVRPTQADVGKSRQLFVAALLGRRWYFRTQGGWQPWSAGEFPVYLTIVMPVELTLQVLDGSVDWSRAIGAQIYVGYGTSAAEMVARGRYALVHTVRKVALKPALRR